MSSCSLLTIHFSLKKAIVASIGIVPISEHRANIVHIRLVVVVQRTTVEIHVPRVRRTVLRTRPVVVGLFVPPVLCLLAPAPSGIGSQAMLTVPVGGPYQN